MSEIKQVLYDMRLSYNGPFIVEDLYKEVDSWIKEKGFVKEHKKKLEHVTKNGKKIEYVLEIHSHLDDLHHGSVVIRMLLDNIKEVTIKKDGKSFRINNGDVFINIDGFIAAHMHGSFWQVKPVYRFFRTLVDKYIYPIWMGKFDGVVNAQGRELYKRLLSFFEVQRYKYD